jgi:pilus assembly protein CpaB
VNRRLLTIVVAFVLAALGSLAVFMYVSAADQRAVRGKRPVDVVVAVKAIPAGTEAARLLPDGYAAVQRFPAASVPDGSLRSIGDGEADLVVGAALRPGELLRKSLLIRKGDSQVFTIPDGKLAISVVLTDPQEVAGHVRPGAKVAVFLTRRVLDARGNPKGELTETRLIMSGVEVLSTGRAPGRDKRANADNKNLVTLAVTQLQAEKLAWSSSNGQSAILYLGLEGGSSELSETTSGVTSFKIFT